MPYSYTALLSLNALSSAYAILGWSDGTKAVALRFLPGASNSEIAEFSAFSSPTVTSVASSITLPNPVWIKLSAGSSTIYWDYSADGVTWYPLYSQVATAYLTAATDVIFGIDNFNGGGTVFTTLMSWTQGTSVGP